MTKLEQTFEDLRNAVKNDDDQKGAELIVDVVQAGIFYLGNIADSLERIANQMENRDPNNLMHLEVTGRGPKG